MGFLKRLMDNLARDKSRPQREGKPEEPAGVRAERLLRTETDDLERLKENLAEHDRIFGRFVERNLEGKRLEKAGELDAAIELYEANVADCFTGRHPYERLRIIYRRRHEYGKALDVCRKYLDILDDRDEKPTRRGDRQHFESWRDKLEAKLAEDEE